MSFSFMCSGNLQSVVCEDKRFSDVIMKLSLWTVWTLFHSSPRSDCKASSELSYTQRVTKNKCLTELSQQWTNLAILSRFQRLLKEAVCYCYQELPLWNVTCRWIEHSALLALHQTLLFQSSGDLKDLETLKHHVFKKKKIFYKMARKYIYILYLIILYWVSWSFIQAVSLWINATNNIIPQVTLSAIYSIMPVCVLNYLLNQFVQKTLIHLRNINKWLPSWMSHWIIHWS